MKKADFIFTVGYHGAAAVVNRRARASAKSLDYTSLLEEGRLRPAFCAALWAAEKEGDTKAIDLFMEKISGMAGAKMTVDDVKRMFGVYQSPQGNPRVLSL